MDAQVILFGLCLLLAPCAAHSDGGVSRSTIIIVVVIIILKIAFWSIVFYRCYQRRTQHVVIVQPPANQRATVVHVQQPQDVNPQHAGYNQFRDQRSAEPLPPYSPAVKTSRPV